MKPCALLEDRVFFVDTVRSGRKWQIFSSFFPVVYCLGDRYLRHFLLREIKKINESGELIKKDEDEDEDGKHDLWEGMREGSFSKEVAFCMVMGDARENGVGHRR